MTGGARSRPLGALFAVVALAFAVPLAILTIVAACWYVSSERGRLTAVAHATADTLRARLDRDFAEMSAVAKTLATSPLIDSSDVTGFEAQARAIIDPTEVTVTMWELDGRNLVNTRAEPGRTLPTIPRPDLAEAVRRTRAPVVSGLMISGLTGQRIVGVSAPVIRNGSVVKAVSVVARVEHFERLLAEEGIAEPFSAALVDGGGTVVALTPGATITDMRVQASREQSITDASGRDRTVAGDDVIEFRDRSRTSDWTIVSGVRKTALEAPLWNSLALFGGSALVLVGLGALLAVRLARRAARGARDLAAAAASVGQGGVVAIPACPIREVDLVGRAMTDASRALARQRQAIEASRATLEARVEEHGRARDAARAHYRVLAENVSDVIVLRRLGSYELSYVSPSSTAMLGYGPDEVRGSEGMANVHPEDIAALRAVDDALGSGRTGVTSLFRMRRRDGQWIWVECLCNRVLSAGPDEPDVVSVMRDVTERQTGAEEQRIARDVAELARAKAENASRAKSEFLALMSHEIRTPLSTIKGFTELLADTKPLSPQQSRYVGLVTDATATMLTAVDDILDFAKVESGDLRLDIRPFALAKAFEAVIAFARPSAASRGVTLGLALGPELPEFVRGDERRLRQIVLNVATTMLRARRGGIATLSVQRQSGASRSEQLSLTVSVSGGQAVSHAPAGIGMTITQRLVGLMDGRLDMAAGPGDASSCRVTLRLPAADAPVFGARPTGSAQPLPARSARLLVAEDHIINQEIARTLLERAGHVVDIVGDGAEALSAVQRETYDLVLMDVQMPGMDGLTATRRIRALQHPSRRVPILAMTANVLPDQIRSFSEAGMNGHVAKPFEREKLCAAVDEHLSSIVLLDAGRPDAGAELPPILDRGAYDRLAANLGVEDARAALAGFIALLDAAHADETTMRADAAIIAVGARRLGLLDLAACHESLAASPAGDDALAVRCRISRDLVHRVLDELTGAVSDAPGSRIALL